MRIVLKPGETVQIVREDNLLAGIVSVDAEDVVKMRVTLSNPLGATVRLGGGGTVTLSPVGKYEDIA